MWPARSTIRQVSATPPLSLSRVLLVREGSAPLLLGRCVIRIRARASAGAQIMVLKGHGFSRAVKFPTHLRGFSPCRFALARTGVSSTSARHPPCLP